MPVELRPRSIGEILDTSFRLVVRNVGAWALIVLLGIAPVTIFSALNYVSAGSLLLDSLAILAFLAGVVGWSVALGALTGAMDRAMRDEFEGVGAALRRGVAVVVKTFLVLLISYIAAVLATMFVFVLAGIAIAVGTFVHPILGLIIGAVVLIGGGVAMVLAVLPRLFLALPAAVIEDLGAFASFRRGEELARGSRWSLVVLFIATYVLVLLPSLAILFIVGFLGGVTDPTSALGVLPLGWFVAQQALSLLAASFTTPLMIAVSVLAYYDRRISVEGYDVEAAADALEG